MTVAIFGLGKMGTQIAKRLNKNNHQVLAWNRSEEPRQEVAKSGVKTFAEIPSLVSEMNEEPRIFWLMLPHKIVDEFLFTDVFRHHVHDLLDPKRISDRCVESRA